MRKHQKLPAYQMQPDPESSGVDLSLATAKPVNDAGCISLVTYLRKGKICHATAAGRKKSEYMRNNYEDSKMSEEGRGAPGILWSGPSIMVDVPSMVKQISILQPVEDPILA